MKKTFDLIAAAGGAKHIVISEKDASPGELDAKMHLLDMLEELDANREQNIVLTCIDFRFWERFLASDELQEELGSDTMALCNHHDCGAYGGLSSFENDLEKEKSAHQVQLLKAGNVICDGDAACRNMLAPVFVDGSFNSYPDTHECDALVIACCEFPHWTRSFERAREEFSLQRFDILTALGGAKAIARPDDDAHRNHMLMNCEISHGLHGIKKGIILVGHEDGLCGVQEGDLHEAADIIRSQEKLADVPVETLWLDKD